MKEIQQGILESVQIIVDEYAKDINFTKSHIGTVKSIKGFKAMVLIFDEEHECMFFEHLYNTIAEGDLVLVQDINNNGVNKFVMQKIRSVPD